MDVLLLILAELCCLADHVSLSAVCRRWRAAEKEARPLPSQIPWLLFPSPSPAPSIYSFLSGTRRRIRSLPADLGRERLCGSHPGGWVAVALGPFGRHLLANVFSAARVALPRMLRNAQFLSRTPLLVRAVMLSAAPTAAHCVAGAIVCGTSNVAFCRPGVDLHWYASDPEIHGLQDMVYYEGGVVQGFHVLTQSGEVRVFAVHVIQGHGTVFGTRALRYMMPQQLQDTVLPLLPKSTSRTRYLVVSREKLLMVLRYYSCDSETGVRRTLLFRVFQMKVKKSAHRRHRASWVELDGLEGRVLFVGRGCSRAFEASQIQGFKDGSIYFLDDTGFDISLALKNQPEYPCSDMGMYSMSKIERPSLDAPIGNMRSPIYGTKTYLSWVHNEENKEARKSFVEIAEDEVQTQWERDYGHSLELSLRTAVHVLASYLVFPL